MASAHIQQNVLFVMFQLLILSVLDYGLGCLTLSEANLLKLERLQNEAMRAVLGCTRDTHIICMRFLLDLSSVRIRHKLAQAKTYLQVMENPHHPLYPSLLTQKGTRIKRGKSWMAEAEDSIKLVCPIEDIIDGREWIKTGPEQTALTKVIITMGRDRFLCFSVQNGDVNAENYQYENSVDCNLLGPFNITINFTTRAVQDLATFDVFREIRTLLLDEHHYALLEASLVERYISTLEISPCTSVYVVEIEFPRIRHYGEVVKGLKVTSVAMFELCLM
ncbi:hypothetical protein EGW08_013489 [Elysia chlorotica]|uniref:Uncharacterized protein n=1 Tax=Elysia chlorotica TaxID=188477 RepID=A0A433TB00_ELYCH|nr:hypothetical protein EGW08_013489 [Elysia chlorotica]